MNNLKPHAAIQMADSVNPMVRQSHFGWGATRQKPGETSRRVPPRPMAPKAYRRLERELMLRALVRGEGLLTLEYHNRLTDQQRLDHLYRGKPLPWPRLSELGTHLTILLAYHFVKCGWKRLYHRIVGERQDNV